jgi:hypothetical protein
VNGTCQIVNDRERLGWDGSMTESERMGWINDRERERLGWDGSMTERERERMGWINDRERMGQGAKIMAEVIFV